MLGLVGCLHIVAVNFFVTLVPDAKELSPQGSQGAQYPISSGECLSAYVAVLEKQILTYTPLSSDVTVKQMAPAYGGLFNDQAVVMEWVFIGRNGLVCEPGM